MTPEDVYKYFENGYKFHKATGMAQSTMTYWKKIGHVPLESQVALYNLTNGKLKLDLGIKKFKKEKEEINK